MFAVFDGHGGAATSEILMNEFPGRLRAVVTDPTWPANAERLLKAAFIRMDQQLAGPPSRVRGSGAVVTVALAIPGEVIVAWVGDSPCVLIDRASGAVKYFTRAHHPSEPDEAARIAAAGGTVEKDDAGTPRVDGGLMISRAIGDFSYKWNTRSSRPPPETADWGSFKVTALPEVARWPVEADSLLVLSSDGLLEGSSPLFVPLPPASVGARVMAAVSAEPGKSLNVVAKQLLEKHIQESGLVPYSGDDLSLLIVPLPPAASGGGRRMRAFKTRRARRTRVGAVGAVGAVA